MAAIQPGTPVPSEWSRFSGTSITITGLLLGISITPVYLIPACMALALNLLLVAIR